MSIKYVDVASNLDAALRVRVKITGLARFSNIDRAVKLLRDSKPNTKIKYIAEDYWDRRSLIYLWHDGKQVHYEIISDNDI